MYANTTKYFFVHGEKAVLPIYAKQVAASIVIMCGTCPRFHHRENGYLPTGDQKCNK